MALQAIPTAAGLVTRYGYKEIAKLKIAQRPQQDKDSWVFALQ